MSVTISSITLIEMTIAASSTLALQSPRADRAAARAQAYAELQEMSEAMVREKGLLNYAQAALLLDVSTKRMSELVRTGKLTRFDFLGRPYVSMREVGQRYQQDLKAGRPRRSVGRNALRRAEGCLKNRSGSGEIGRLCGSICSGARPRAKREEPRRASKGVASDHGEAKGMSDSNGECLISLEEAAGYSGALA